MTDRRPLSLRVRRRLVRLWRGLRRFERHELAAARRWLEDTENLLHLSALCLVPVLVGAVTSLASAVPSLSFLLFPPLASGAYTLFAHPESRYADPLRFVVGMTVGATCGWIATVVTGTGAAGEVGPLASALAVLLAGAATWLLHVEEPAAYAVALLLLVQEAPPTAYVASVAVASGVVALAYHAWHDGIYERRAELLYASTGADDDILVPMVDGAEPVATLAARLATGYDHGRVVLLGLLDPATDAASDADGSAADAGAAAAGDGAGRATGGDPTGAADDLAARDSEAPAGAATSDAEAFTDGIASDAAAPADATTAEAVPDDPVPEDRSALLARLEERADRLAAETGADVEVALATGADRAAATLEAARETGCDLVASPLDGNGADSLVTSLFVDDLDVAAARVDRDCWRDVLVPIRSAGDLAHVKVDIARRLVGGDGRVTVAHCIDAESERRHAEAMCANVVDPYDGRFETLVARAPVEAFLADHASANDLVVLGASTDRTRVSRLLARPTYERVRDLPTDLLVVHAGRR